MLVPASTHNARSYVTRPFHVATASDCLSIWGGKHSISHIGHLIFLSLIKTFANAGSSHLRQSGSKVPEWVKSIALF